MTPEESEHLLRQKLERAQAELTMLYEISNAMRSTLELEEILRIILTGVTAHAGLGFNRAMLFLINENQAELEGQIGIGPDSSEEATRIWHGIDQSHTTLLDLVDTYRKQKTEIERSSKLNEAVKRVHIPLADTSNILVQTVRRGMPIRIQTERARRYQDTSMVNELNLQSYVCVPMKSKNRTIGVILADNRFTQKPITKYDVRSLILFANQAALAIENSKLFEQTLISAKTDQLTGLWNHGHFQHTLTAEWQRAVDNHHSLCLIMLDLDHFKEFNDRYGHELGNAALRKLAGDVTGLCRKSDFVARYGGEEFALILPYASKAEGIALAERIRTAVASAPPIVQSHDDGPAHLTLSMGVAAYPDDASSHVELIQLADRALYDAKRGGRNRVVAHGDVVGKVSS